MKKRLIDVRPEWMTKGIFYYLNDKDVPWEVPAAPLDLAYFGNNSGEKLISPVVSKLLVNGKLSDATMSNLATTIFYLYNDYWTKEFATLSAQYNPISNYDMTETESIEREGSDGHTRTNTGTVQDAGTHANTRTNTGTVTDAGSHSETTSGSADISTTANGTSENEVSAFNSAAYVDNDKNTNNTTTSSDTDTSTSRSGTDGNTRTDNLSESNQGTDGNTRTNNLSEGFTGTHSDTEDRTLTRSGNIGVTTSQQMLESERELWMWNFFLNVVFPDIDKILTIRVYSIDNEVNSNESSGGGDVDTQEILAAIRNAQDNINAHTDSATSGLATTTNVNNATANINAHTDSATDGLATTTNVNNAVNSINNNTDADTSLIRGDIVEVTTNGY